LRERVKDIAPQVTGLMITRVRAFTMAHFYNGERVLVIEQ